MSWFDASNIANLAKNALKEAQKTLDKALDINEEEKEQLQDQKSEANDSNQIETKESGLESNSSHESKLIANSTIWESFASSFFEKSKPPTEIKDESESKINVIPSTEFVVTKEPLSESFYVNDQLLNRPTYEDKNISRPHVAETSDELKSNDNTNSREGFSVVLRKAEKKRNNGNRLSVLSTESDRKSTVSSDSIEVLGSTSTTTPDSEISSSKLKNNESYEFFTEINSAEDSCRIQTETTSSESVEIIPEIEDDTENDGRSIGGGAYDTSASESALTVLETGQRSSLKDILKSSSSMDTSLTEVLSPWECGLNPIASELPEITQSDSQSEFLIDSITDSKLPIKRSRNEISGTSVNTLDSSSCDEGTMIGSSSDEAPKECTSSVSSLKSMLADAINEQPDDWPGNARESSPTASSMGSRHENIKIGSSGHTSADELETATSSDIEIISSPNGDSSNADSRQSPAKLIYKNSRGKMSVVLSSDVLIPEIIGRSLSFKMKGHNREPSETSSGGSDDIIEVDRLLKKIAELNEILDVRESKLVDLSMKNAELSESNTNLKSQLEYQMNEKFTQRLAALEKKFQQAIREKELLWKKLENYKHLKESSEFEEDKDQIIKELREEGEKLSKQQLASNVLIKKLRTAEKDHLKLISSFKEQCDGLMQEVERAKKSLNVKEELERLQVETINQLTKKNQQLEKQSDVLQTQINNLTSTLISCQNEMTDKENKLSALDHRLQEASSLATKEVLRRAESDLKEERDRVKQLETSLENLQMTLQNIEKQHSERETVLRQENQKLVNTLEEHKRRNEHLSEEMVNATKPIVQQLQDEISKHNATVTLLEKQEQDLTIAMNELQDRLKVSLENEQKYEERYLLTVEEMKELKSKIKLLQNEIENKISQVKFELNVNNLLREENERTRAEKNEEIKRLKNQLEETLSQKAEESQFERPKNINELYKDRSKLKLLLQGDVSGKDSDSDVSMSSPTPSPHPSEESNIWLGNLDEDLGPSSSQKGSIYDGATRHIATAASTIENLQTQHKLKEGEVQQLHWEIKRHEHEKIILTNEITILASKVEELDKKLTVHNELQTRYDALLQMYGEKMEECQELRLDLEDVKEMYKIQIDELLTRSRTG